VDAAVHGSKFGIEACGPAVARNALAMLQAGLYVEDRVIAALHPCGRIAQEFWSILLLGHPKNVIASFVKFAARRH